MAELIYSTISSLDGYVADEVGHFDWAEPDEEVHTFINDLHRPVGTYLYGRRLYEVMIAWETLDVTGQPPYVRDCAEMWRRAGKVVYSRTLPEVSSARTTIDREFDPRVVRKMKQSAACDLAVGGANLAASAFKAGLVDNCYLFLAPIVVGGAKRALPSDVRMEVQLVDERRFRGGMVYLRYSRGASSSYERKE